MSLHSIPIEKRPRRQSRYFAAALFAIIWNTCCLAIHASQLLLLPLRLLSEVWWDEFVRYTKGCFTTAMIWMCQLFAPTEFVITTEGAYFEQPGVLQMDENGVISTVNLPERLVLISNHQVYLDWWYLWCFTYWTGHHKDVVIVLKKSLKWIPIVGWGMIFFHFVFLARSWAADSAYFIRQLGSIAERSMRQHKRLAFILYPEGTLVSKDTRPLSKKYADKCGMNDLNHVLLPRATGLHYTLRTLAPRIPDLHVLDLTMAYEGIPRNGYGQSYYTLRSVFLDGVPPPRIHVHLRLYNVKADIPIGDVDVHGHRAPSQSRKESEITGAESKTFEQWILKVWREKDLLLENFLQSGSLTYQNTDTASVGKRMTIPVRLESPLDAVHTLGLLGPGLLILGMRRIASIVRDAVRI